MVLLLGACIANLFAGEKNTTDCADCDDPDLGIGPPDPDGYTIDHFPVSGVRIWTYTTPDPEVEWIVEARTRWSGEDTADPVHHIDYDTDCEDTDVLCVGGSRVRTYDVENTEEFGLRLHGYNEAGNVHAYNPPLPIAVVGMGPGDELLTIVGGDTWTSTLVGHVSCLDVGASMDLDCLHFAIENRSGNSGSASEGDWYLASGVGLAAQALDQEFGRLWSVQTYACLTDCE
jgi:hypothetical protein